MAPLLLSILTPSPPGFKYCNALETKDVRRQMFALAAASPEAAEAALAPWIGKISGLIVTDAHPLQWEQRPSGLYHFGVPPELRPNLSQLLIPLLEQLAEGQRLRNRELQTKLELQRMAEDRARATEAFTHTQQGLLQEIADRRTAAEALRQSEERFRMIFNSVNDAIFIHDAETGAILDVNQRMCELYGYTREEVLKLKNVQALSSGCDGYDYAHAAEYLRAAAAGQPKVFPWQARHRSGTLFWVEVSMRRAEINGQARILVTVRDITERKAEEESRHRLEQQMQQMQKLESLGVLAGGIAHDFNNILMVILGNADLALNTLPPTTPARSQLDDISTAARRAADLCSQMLAYAGKGKFQVKPVNLNGIITDITHLLKVSTFKKAALRFTLSHELPTIEADATQIGQIIMNLVINASEAIGDQTGIISISTGSMHCDQSYLASTLIEAEIPEGEYVFLEVSDTGHGMSRETMSRIFDPFFTTKFTGRGLGLAAVLGIVRSHHGTMKVYSEVGKGTAFKVLFPAIQTAAPHAATIDTDANWKGSGTLLLVDDEESILRTGEQLLRHIGFNVITAVDGRDAMKKVMSTPAAGIDGVILDLNMPYMGGEETCRELRKLCPTLPVIISSGYCEDEVMQRFLGKGIAAVIHKPYRISELRRKLHQIFANIQQT